MRVLGIDLAAQPKRTYACLLDQRLGELHGEIHRSCDDDRLQGLAVGCRKVAIDAPFGWPNEFVDALDAHRAGGPWPAPDDESPEIYRAALSFRATDRVVMHTRRPLSVSTDKLGVTAMRCAYLLDRWGRSELVNRTGTGTFVEVYPAGALARWGLEATGYKGADSAPLAKLLSMLRAALPALVLGDDARQLCASVDDAFDALISALVARAALLGLTDPPPEELRARAAEEGWIHLPVRGSLPFLAQRKRELIVRPAAALAKRLRETGVEVDDRGYAARIEDVLLPTLSRATREAIEADLAGKGGSELVSRSGRHPKFRAAHSSAALAANTFGPFLREHAGVPIGDRIFVGKAALEVECRTGLRGTPPTVDCLVDGDEVLAIESKCTEPFSPHTANFKDVYADVMARMHRSWREEYRRLSDDPTRYRHLDAAQLVKHYAGLRTAYTDRPITLAYLYWTPTNAADLAPCAIHTSEIDTFAAGVHDPRVTFVAMSYRDIWAQWALPTQPAWLQRHARTLRGRYDIPA